MRAVVAAVAALVLMIGVCGLGLHLSKDGTLATNGIEPAVFVLDLRAQQRVCDSPPPGIGATDEVAIAMTAGGYGEEARLRLESLDRTPLAASEQPDSSGRVSFLLRTPEAASDRKICVRNVGDSRIAVAGQLGVPPGVTVAGQQRDARVSFYADQVDPPTWLSETPSTVTDIGSAQGAAVGPGTGWVAVILALVGAFLAAFVACRAALGRTR